MLKKYKILALMTILSLVGIVGIISVWLIGNYKHQQIVLLTDIERTLFNTVQTYYEKHQDVIDDKRKSSLTKEGSKFANRIKTMYPNIDTAKIIAVWDSLGKERTKRYGEWRKNRSDNKEGQPHMIMPAYMLQNIDFNVETLSDIEEQFDLALKAKGINSDSSISLRTLKNNNPSKKQHKLTIEDGIITTRPILVNPSQSQFLVAEMDHPLLYILGKMSIQIILSVLLLLALIWTYIYLIWTINKQNKLAVLRKSFVNNMTHELKTPVATVMAAVEAVQRYGAKDDKVKMGKYLSISQNELDHLSKMIERVLQLDVDEISGLILEKSKVDLNNLVNQCIETAKISSKKPLSINFHTDQPETFIQVDESHFKNVLNNLIDNAIKYSNDKVAIDIEIKNLNDNIHLVVKDNGIGIEDKYHKDVFDMFFRVPNGNLHPVKGFGLGLAYVKQVIKAHNGHIAINSIINQGTTFNITLPKP